MKPFILSLSFLLFLTGCSSNKPVDEAQDKNPAETTPVEEPVKEPAQENDDKELLPEKELQFTLKGEKKTEKAKLTESKEQSYAMYVLPEFELTAEEPGKDMLYHKSEDEHFMRIERIDSYSSLSEVEENTKNQLSAISENVSIPNDIKDADATVYQAENGNDLAIGYFFKDKEKPFRVLIYTKKDNDYSPALLEMARTIVSKK